MIDWESKAHGLVFSRFFRKNNGKIRRGKLKSEQMKIISIEYRIRMKKAKTLINKIGSVDCFKYIGTIMKKLYRINEE